MNSPDAAGLYTFKRIIVCYVNFTTIIKKMKGQNCKIIIIIPMVLDTLQKFDKVNTKRTTSTPCLMVDINISIKDFIFSSRQAHRLADEETVESRSSVGDFFLKQARPLPTWRICPLWGSLPAWEGFPPNHCFSLISCWSLLQESPHGKGLPSHPISKSRPPTPASGHSFSLTLFFFKILSSDYVLT